MPGQWWIIVAVVVFAAVVLLVWRPLRAAARESRFARARRDFHRQRERLEAKFVQLASRRSANDSPRWDDCDFDDDVSYVRNRSTGEISAFVAVTVAIGDPDDPVSSISDLIGNLRSGTAIFRLDDEHWETEGRAILNLSPAEAVRFYQDDLEMVEQEWAHRPLGR